MRTVKDPDEVYLDERNGIHVLKRIQSNKFLVVIYGPNDIEGVIRTAYVTSNARKNRRCKNLRRLKHY